jgi:hypothetical protein
MGILGDVTKALFGGSSKKEKSESGNLNNDYLMGAYSPMVSGGTGAYGQYGAMLGQGPEGFSNYLDSTGYNFIQDEAMQGLTNAFAGRGMLRSGAAGKAFQDRAANIGKTYFDNYLGHLGNMSQLGLGAGGLIADAGQYSKGSGSGSEFSGGLGKAIGSIFASDRRLKDGIELVGEYPDGLGVYDFRYHWDDPGTVRTGVMADEVEQLRPWALGPVIGGYATVDYGRL